MLKMNSGDSKGRRRAGADELAGLLAEIAEAMRQAAVEEISLARPEHPALLADRHFKAARDDDPALLALMR